MAASDVAAKAADRVLLPDAVLPSRYEIRLTPDLERFVFDGKVRIHVDVHEATNEVTLHSKELSVSSASFTPSEGSAVEVVVISQNLKETTVTLTFAEVLPVGPGVVEVEFIGILNNQMAGFYRSGYKDINGVEKIMASTQFESLDARRCFPCWDEPARKAAFAVTLVVDTDLTAFSNMPEKSCQIIKVGKKAKKELVFLDSPKMSTYLVAFVIGEFDFIQATTQNGVLVRVYTPPGRAEAGTFALDVATKSLDIYDDFFGTPYPLPKLDMVAIPEFAMGAMENWGLVTYREVDLLIDRKTASGQQKQRVCIVVTHELAHQWFGNLVTMAWWDDLWLNEGFASWCENYAADLIFPDYRIWDQFPADTLSAALRLDALRTSHPIQVPICHAEEVEEVFDAISYCKGASVIRMAHAVLGHEAFRNGLVEYMKEHKYGNTETFHLWDAWAKSSGKPVKDIMSSWTEQMGFPLVEVVSCSFQGSVAKLVLKQSWFLASGEDPGEVKTWSLPLFVGTLKEQSRVPVMMTGESQELEVALSGDADAEFILINLGVQTPMRVAYTPELRQRLAKAVSAGKLSVVDRAALVMDAYALAKAGKLGTDELLRFLAGYAGETDYIVWEALASSLLGLQRVLMGGAPEDVYTRFMSFGEEFIWKSWQAANLGWESRPSDGHTDGMLRGLLMKLVSRFNPNTAFTAEAKQRFDRYVEDPLANAQVLPDEYRVPIFQAVLKTGSASERTKLLDVYRKVVTNVDQKQVFQAIGFSPDMPLKKESLQWAISGEVKIQDFYIVMGSVSASSKAGLDMMWEFLKSDFDAIHGMVKNASPSIMDSVIGAATSGYCSAEKADEIEKFFEANNKKLSSNKRTISQVLEDIRTNAKFLGRALETDLVKPKFWDELRASSAFLPGSRI
mmetsp:Transcript_89966/g.162274  ORF Transcript_89966/g.162274 Transcript_89966/m.162274 type:complete len:905 (-) Transcript_89966:51-2765(-)